MKILYIWSSLLLYVHFHFRESLKIRTTQCTRVWKIKTGRTRLPVTHICSRPIYTSWYVNIQEHPFSLRPPSPPPPPMWYYLETDVSIAPKRYIQLQARREKVLCRHFYYSNKNQTRLVYTVMAKTRATVNLRVNLNLGKGVTDLVITVVSPRADLRNINS